MSFSFKVEHYNKEGKVVHKDPYRMVIDQEHGQRMERPPGSGIWYRSDGSIFKDESAAIEAQKAQADNQKQMLSEQKALEAREKLKAELRAEILAEQKVQVKSGSGNKV